MCSVSLSKESVHICLSICTPTYAFSTILPFVPHPLIYPSIHPSIHLSAYVSRYCEVLARCKLQIEAKSMQSSGVFLSLSLSPLGSFDVQQLQYMIGVVKEIW